MSNVPTTCAPAGAAPRVPSARKPISSLYFASPWLFTIVNRTNRPSTLFAAGKACPSFLSASEALRTGSKPASVETAETSTTTSFAPRPPPSIDAVSNSNRPGVPGTGSSKTKTLFDTLPAWDAHPVRGASSINCTAGHEP